MSGEGTWRLWRAAAAAGSPVMLVACAAAPSQNVLGSYFPSWMFCALLGIVLAAVVHKVLSRVGVTESVPAPLLVNLALTAAFSFAIWLLWLG